MQRFVRIKNADPNCKFRLEVNCSQVKESVSTSQSRSQGLQAPESHFVDEVAFKAYFGRDPTDDEVVFEEWDGVKMRGDT